MSTTENDDELCHYLSTLDKKFAAMSPSKYVFLPSIDMKMQSLIMGCKGGGSTYPISNRTNFRLCDIWNAVGKWDFCDYISTAWPRKSVAMASQHFDNLKKLLVANGLSESDVDNNVSAMGALYRDGSVQGQFRLVCMPHLMENANQEIIHIDINSLRKVIVAICDTVLCNDDALMFFECLIAELGSGSFHNIANFINMRYYIPLKAEMHDRQQVIVEDIEVDSAYSATTMLEVDIQAELTRVSQLHLIGRECSSITKLFFNAFRKACAASEKLHSALVPLFALLSTCRDLVSLLKTTSVGDASVYTEAQQEENFSILHGRVVLLAHRFLAIAQTSVHGSLMSPTVASLCTFAPDDMLYFWKKYRILFGLLSAEAGERTVGTVKESLRYHTMKSCSDNVNIINHLNSKSLFLLEKCPAFSNKVVDRAEDMSKLFDMHSVPSNTCLVCQAALSTLSTQYCTYCENFVLPFIKAVDEYHSPDLPVGFTPAHVDSASANQHLSAYRSAVQKAASTVSTDNAHSRLDKLVGSLCAPSTDTLVTHHCSTSVTQPVKRRRPSSKHSKPTQMVMSTLP